MHLMRLSHRNRCRLIPWFDATLPFRTEGVFQASELLLHVFFASCIAGLLKKDAGVVVVRARLITAAQRAAGTGMSGGVIVRQVASGDRRGLCRCTQTSAMQPSGALARRLRARFCSRRARIAVAQGAQRRNHRRKTAGIRRMSVNENVPQQRWAPKDRQDQMAIRGLLGGILFMTIGAIVPAGAQTPPSSSPPQAPQAAQVPGKTPQERCYYRYMTAHGYHHVGPKAHAACPDPNQEQPNN